MSFKTSFKTLCLAVTLLAAPLTHAAYVTIDEVGLDAVFSQASFGDNKIDIRVGGITQIVRPDLLADRGPPGCRGFRSRRPSDRPRRRPLARPVH